jgi:hypothetical protein
MDEFVSQAIVPVVNVGEAYALIACLANNAHRCGEEYGCLHTFISRKNQSGASGVFPQTVRYISRPENDSAKNSPWNC